MVGNYFLFPLLQSSRAGLPSYIIPGCHHTRYFTVKSGREKQTRLSTERECTLNSEQAEHDIQEQMPLYFYVNVYCVYCVHAQLPTLLFSLFSLSFVTYQTVQLSIMREVDKSNS